MFPENGHHRVSVTQTLLIVLIICGTIIIIHTGVNLDRSSSNFSFRSPLPVPPSSNVRKKILFGNRLHQNAKHFGGIHEANEMCPRCIFTHDQAEWNSSDAVVLNGRFLEKNPPFRPHGQIWIYYYSESVARMKKPEKEKLANYRGMFNWTITYRHDSDIYSPYRTIENYSAARLSEGSIATHQKPAIRNKQKTVAWIVSDCDSASNNRRELAAALAKHVPLDIYGSCGKFKCKTDRSKSIGADCREEISGIYKFYLAFENSLCGDYITEKFFDTLLTDMVPIVYGGANYSVLGLPEKTYINVADFETVEALADYILWLDKNPQEYMKYLTKKHLYKLYKTPSHHVWCELCTKLWEKHSNSYPDMYEWWIHSPNGKPACASTESLPIMRNLLRAKMEN